MSREELMAIVLGDTAQYWWIFPKSDCGYDDVTGSCQGLTVDGCKAKCLSTSGCGGFNYPHGVLKKVRV
jgi:hypothetical protein